MRVWRTISVLALMLILAAPLLYLSFLQLQQLYIKHGLEERLETHLLKTVFIPQQNWKGANSDEILIEGKLFDIEEMHATKNGVLVTGVFDDEETAVVQQLDKSCSANHAKDTPVFAQFFELLQGLFFQANATILTLSEVRTKLFQTLIWHLPCFYKQVLSPPPQVFA